MRTRSTITTTILFCFIATLFQPYSVASNDIVTQRASFDVPFSIGKIMEQFDAGSSAPLVLVVKDLHCHTQVQHNITKLLEYCTEYFGQDINLVGMEGAFGVVDPSLIATIPDGKIKQSVMSFYTNKGAFSGAEVYAIQHPKRIVLYGIENKELYRDNFLFLYESLAYRTVCEQTLDELTAMLREGKHLVYPRALKQFEAREQLYIDGKCTLNTHLAYLKTKAQSLDIDCAAIAPEIETMEHAHAVYNTVDMQRMRAETTALLSTRALTNDARQELQAVQSKGDRTYYRMLDGLLCDKNISITDTYPNLASYLEYVRAMQSLRELDLMKQMRALTYQIKTMLAQSRRDAADIVWCEHHLELLRLYLLNQAQADGIAEWNANKDQFTQVASRLSGLLTVHNTYQQKKEMLAHVETLMNGFYSRANERNDAMVSRLLTAATTYRSPVSMMVIGGYHTDGVTRILRDKGISYRVIAPYISEKQDTTQKYLDLMKEQAPWLITTPLPSVASLSPKKNNVMLAIMSRLQDAKAQPAIIAKIVETMLKERKGGGRLEWDVLQFAKKTRDEQRQAFEVKIENGFVQVTFTPTRIVFVFDPQGNEVTTLAGKFSAQPFEQTAQIMAALRAAVAAETDGAKKKELEEALHDEKIAKESVATCLKVTLGEAGQAQKVFVFDKDGNSIAQNADVPAAETFLRAGIDAAVVKKYIEEAKKAIANERDSDRKKALQPEFAKGAMGVADVGTSALKKITVTKDAHVKVLLFDSTGSVVAEDEMADLVEKVITDAGVRNVDAVKKVVEECQRSIKAIRNDDMKKAIYAAMRAGHIVAHKLHSQPFFTIQIGITGGPTKKFIFDVDDGTCIAEDDTCDVTVKIMNAMPGADKAVVKKVLAVCKKVVGSASDELKQAFSADTIHVDHHDGHRTTISIAIDAHIVPLVIVDAKGDTIAEGKTAAAADKIIKDLGPTSSETIAAIPNIIAACKKIFGGDHDIWRAFTDGVFTAEKEDANIIITVKDSEQFVFNDKGTLIGRKEIAPPHPVLDAEAQKRLEERAAEDRRAREQAEQAAEEERRQRLETERAAKEAEDRRTREQAEQAAEEEQRQRWETERAAKAAEDRRAQEQAAEERQREEMRRAQAAREAERTPQQVFDETLKEMVGKIALLQKALGANADFRKTLHDWWLDIQVLRQQPKNDETIDTLMRTYQDINTWIEKFSPSEEVSAELRTYSEVDNTGGGDCMFLAFAQGLLEAIVRGELSAEDNEALRQTGITVDFARTLVARSDHRFGMYDDERGFATFLRNLTPAAVTMLQPAIDRETFQYGLVNSYVLNGYLAEGVDFDSVQYVYDPIHPDRDTAGDYARYICTQGMWGTQLELTALAHYFGVRVTVDQITRTGESVYAITEEGRGNIVIKNHGNYHYTYLRPPAAAPAAPAPVVGAPWRGALSRLFAQLQEKTTPRFLDFRWVVGKVADMDAAFVRGKIVTLVPTQCGIAPENIHEVVDFRTQEGVVNIDEADMGWKMETDGTVQLYYTPQLVAQCAALRRLDEAYAERRLQQMLGHEGAEIAAYRARSAKKLPVDTASLHAEAVSAESDDVKKFRDEVQPSVGRLMQADATDRDRMAATERDIELLLGDINARRAGQTPRTRLDVIRAFPNLAQLMATLGDREIVGGEYKIDLRELQRAGSVTQLFVERGLIEGGEWLVPGARVIVEGDIARYDTNDSRELGEISRLIQLAENNGSMVRWNCGINGLDAVQHNTVCPRVRALMYEGKLTVVQPRLLGQLTSGSGFAEPWVVERVQKMKGRLLVEQVTARDVADVVNTVFRTVVLARELCEDAVVTQLSASLGIDEGDRESAIAQRVAVLESNESLKGLLMHHTISLRDFVKLMSCSDMLVAHRDEHHGIRYATVKPMTEFAQEAMPETIAPAVAVPVAPLEDTYTVVVMTNQGIGVEVIMKKGITFPVEEGADDAVDAHVAVSPVVLRRGEGDVSHLTVTRMIESIQRIAAIHILPRVQTSVFGMLDLSRIVDLLFAREMKMFRTEKDAQAFKALASAA